MSQTVNQGWTPPPDMDPKAAAKAAKAYAKATRPWYRKKRFIGLGVIALIVIIAVANSGGKGSTPTTSSTSPKTAVANSNQNSSTGQAVISHTGTDAHPAAADVAVSSCGKDDMGSPQALVTVTNHSSKTSSYMITIAFVSGNEQIDTGDVAVDNLAPGQVAKQTADSFKTDGVPATFNCKVAQVDRLAS